MGAVGAGAAAEAAAQADAATPTDEGSGDGPPRPSNLSADGEVPNWITLSWDPPSAVEVDHYEVAWEDARQVDRPELTPPRVSGSTTVEADADEVTVHEVESGVPYRFTVVAVDGEGDESPPATVEARTDAAPTDPYVADFDDDSFTVGWTPPWRGADGVDVAEYTVTRNSDVVQRVEPDVASTTVPVSEPGAYDKVYVEAVDGDGEDTQAWNPVVHARVGTDPGPGVERYFVSKPLNQIDGSGNRADVTVEDGRVRLEGTLRALTTGCTAVVVREVSYEDGVARVALETEKIGGGCLLGSGEIPYRAGLDLDDDPEAVVVDFWLSDEYAVWQRDGLDGTVIVEPADDHLGLGQTTEASLVLYGESLDVGRYDVDVALDRAGVVEIDEIAVSDDLTGTVESSVAADGSAASVALDLDGDGLATDGGRLELATVSLTATGPGRASLAVDSLSASTPAGTELDVGTVGTDVSVDPIEPVTGDVPTDLDDDGLYEDVNGNGEGDLADAVDLFQHRESSAVTNHTAAYDFSGNDEVDLADVVDLFQENSG